MDARLASLFAWGAVASCADALTTRIVLSNPRGFESNPVLRAVFAEVGTNAGLVLRAVLGVAVFGWLTLTISHPRMVRRAGLLRLLMFGLAVATSFVVVWNLAVLSHA